MGRTHKLRKSFYSMNPSIEIEIQGQKKSYPSGITPGEILKEITLDNGRDIVAAEVNGVAIDLSAAVTSSGNWNLSVYNTQGS